MLSCLWCNDDSTGTFKRMPGHRLRTRLVARAAKVCGGLALCVVIGCVVMRSYASLNVDQISKNTSRSSAILTLNSVRSSIASQPSAPYLRLSSFEPQSYSRYRVCCRHGESNVAAIRDMGALLSSSHALTRARAAQALGILAQL